MAESSTLRMVGAMRLLVWRKIMRASLAERPRIRSITSRAFCGDDRMYRASALACMVVPLGGLGALLGGRRSLHRMAFKHTRGRKLTQLVAHHVFGNVDRNEFLAVMHTQGVTDEIWNDGGTTRPGSHHLLLVLGVHISHLFRQVVIGKRPFFKRSAHSSNP